MSKTVLLVDDNPIQLSARQMVLSQAGLPVTLPYLDDLTHRWAGSSGDQQSCLWREAHDLASHMLAQWRGNRCAWRLITSPGSLRLRSGMTRRSQRQLRYSCPITSILGDMLSRSRMAPLRSIASNRCCVIITRPRVTSTQSAYQVRDENNFTACGRRNAHSP